MLGSLTLSFMFQAFEYISLHQFNHLFLSSKLADQIKDVHAQADQCEKVRACKEQVTPDRPNAHQPLVFRSCSEWWRGSRNWSSVVEYERELNFAFEICRVHLLGSLSNTQRCLQLCSSSSKWSLAPCVFIGTQYSRSSMPNSSRLTRLSCPCAPSSSLIRCAQCLFS